MGIKYEGKDFLKKQSVDHKSPLANSFRYAGRGILRVFRSERSFRLQILAFILVVIAGFIFRITGIEWILILIAGSTVLVSEMINTAVEYIIDLVTEEYRILAGHIKNVTAGAVLVSAIIAAIVGLIVFVPYFLEYI
ncbi:MAG: diacylglycerol kinase family protein [Actinomycetia bacterium]|nr:diacylglycerol kinase family protein [Actinomycetes bacterium]